MRNVIQQNENRQQLASDVPSRALARSPNLAGQYFRTPEAAEYLKVSVSWLNKKRVYGGGPRYHKVGTMVVYSLQDLEAFLASNARNHTSERPRCPEETAGRLFRSKIAASSFRRSMVHLARHPYELRPWKAAWRYTGPGLQGRLAFSDCSRLPWFLGCHLYSSLLTHVASRSSAVYTERVLSSRDIDEWMRQGW